jgi:hypothetical protein
MYGNSLPGYDAWLERPYQDACADADRYIEWCESRNMDPDEPESQVAYSDWIDSQWGDMEEYYDDDISDEIDYDCYDIEPDEI